MERLIGEVAHVITAIFFMITAFLLLRSCNHKVRENSCYNLDLADNTLSQSQPGLNAWSSIYYWSTFFFLSSLLLGVVVRIRKTTTPKEKTKKKKTNNEMKEM
jgi:hypothetical protein